MDLRGTRVEAVLTLAVLTELLEGAPVALVVVDERRIVRLFNRAAAQLCGISAGAVVGRALERALPRHEDLSLERASYAASGWQVLVLSPRERRRGAASAPRVWRGRVLVAEDNLVSQRVAVAMLGRLGLRCEAASDGVEALARAAEAPFDAILMDCHMPQLDGMEAIRALRAWPEPRRSVAVIAMTSGSAEERAACFEAGADACLQKPVALPEVKEVLARWLTAPELPVLSEEVLGDLVVEMGVAEVESLIEDFLAQLERVTQELRDAVGRVDLDVASRAGHGLVGSAGTLGAASLVAACRDLERVCRWPAPRFLQEATDEVLAAARLLEPALTGWACGRHGTG